jgi:hypothetical protein
MHGIHPSPLRVHVQLAPPANGEIDIAEVGLLRG